MKNDLKSSEALKAYARKVICGQNPTNSLLIRMFDEIIDNAPTIEVATNLQPTCNNLQPTCNKLQGEWIGNAFDEHHCNRCGHPALWEEEFDDYYEVQSRFCPNCGADMRGDNNG